MTVIIRTAAVLTGASFVEPGFTSLWWQPGTAGGSTADATDCLARFRSFWESAKTVMDPGITVDYDPVCIAVESTTGVLTGAFTGTDPASTVGTATGDVLPHQTQGLVKFSTASVFNGRRLRGRLFVPGPVESANGATGSPSSAYVTALNTAGALLLAAGATASVANVWHRPVAGVGGASAITAVSASTSWSVLRSRR